MSAVDVVAVVAFFLWMAAITAVTVVLVAGLLAERFNCRANHRVNDLLAEFDATKPQFNEDHPEWNRK